VPIAVNKVSKRLGLPISSGHLIQKKARQLRRKLTAGERDAYSIDVQQRVGNRRKLTPTLLKRIADWLGTYKHIRTSPNKKDVLLVRGADGKKNVKVPRLYVEVGFTQANLDCKKELGAQLPIGERSFRNAMPPNVRHLLRCLESCGCGSGCIKMTRLHEALVRWRRKHKCLNPNYKPYEHATWREARDEGAEAGGCPNTVLGVRKARCWMLLGCPCGGVRKRYKVNPFEAQVGATAPTISFSIFEAQEDAQAKPTKDGKPRKKTVLVKYTKPIGVFMDEYYVPGLEQIDYHSNLETVLNTCVACFIPQHGDAHVRRDFAKKLGQEFENAPQGADHW